jgi:hypothetical protein
MKVYSIKVALRGISPMIFRRLRIPDRTSLADLHHIIQIAMGWGNEHLHCFHIYGKDYGITYEGGLSFSDDARTVTVEDFGFDIGERFTYTYNFYDNVLCDIRIENIQSNDKPIVPFCTSGQGRLIDNKSYYRVDEQCALFDTLVEIFHGDEATTTVGDIRLLIEKYETIRFNRQSINTSIAFQLTQAV